MRFRDRQDAGRHLAAALGSYAGRDDVLILALPRGGVPVGYEVARALGAPLDVMQVRKLGVPGHEELAMGAIASGGVRILSEGVVETLGIPERVIATVAAAEEQELDRRERVYREGRPFPEVRGRTVILVDDGLATGSTMRAAAAALRAHGAGRLVAAVPVAPRESCDVLRDLVDEVICAVTPEPFLAVGEWYEDFTQTSDADVQDLLRRAASAGAAGSLYEVTASRCRCWRWWCPWRTCPSWRCPSVRVPGRCLPSCRGCRSRCLPHLLFQRRHRGRRLHTQPAPRPRWSRVSRMCASCECPL